MGGVVATACGLLLFGARHAVADDARTPSASTSSGAGGAGEVPPSSEPPVSTGRKNVHGAPVAEPLRGTPVRENPDGEQDPVDAPDAAAPPPHASSLAPPPQIPRIRVENGAVLVPAGNYKLGTDDAKAPIPERPSRHGFVPAFWMDKTEVSVADYRACVDAGACARPRKSSARCTYDKNDGLLPVTCVHWSDATRYCRYQHKRLPTEAEWEAAARGPLENVGGSGCYVAVTLLSETTARSCFGDAPGRVGARPTARSPLGIDDMRGNVEEWVEDYYQELRGNGPPRAGASHVIRGGGWLSPPSQARVHSRSWGSVLEAGPNVGIRCARDAQP